MKWKLTPNGIRMMKKSLMKNILNVGQGDMRHSKIVDGPQSFPDDSPGDVSASLPTVENEGDDRHFHPFDPVLIKRNLNDAEAKNQHASQAAGKKNKPFDRLPPTKVEPEKIQGVKTQLKNAINTAKERSVKHRPSSDNDPEVSNAQVREYPLSSRTKNHGGNYENSMNPKIAFLLTSDSIEAECFKLFRTLMVYPSSSRIRRSILMTCEGPEETLMIDCDLRQPQLHDLFGIGSVVGLSEYFTGNVLCREKLHKIDNGQMYILSKDSAHSTEMSRLIDELVSSYENHTVILDSAPFVNGGGMNEMGDAGGSLMVIDYGVMPPENVKEMLTLIGRDKILGSVKRGEAAKKTSFDRNYIPNR